MDPRPIGIFDSGLGGLTAARTLEEILPGEDLVYFGDSANAPYGTRSREELLELATGNAAFLQSFHVKAILVACGTVSTNVLDQVAERFPVPFFGVLRPACDAALRSGAKRVAVAATEATIRSDAYAQRLKQGAAAPEVFSKACQSLVALAERGHFRPGDPLAEAAVAAEFAPIRDFAPDTVILACTHFPLFDALIQDYLGQGVRLLSVSQATALALREYLLRQGATAERTEGTRRWFTSGDPQVFGELAGGFLGHKVAAQRHETAAI